MFLQIKLKVIILNKFHLKTRIFKSLIMRLYFVNLITPFLLILVNIIPSIILLKELKCFLLLISGVKLDIRKVYVQSNIAIDRPRNIKIGKNVFINRNVYFEGTGKVIIGNFNQIGPNVTFSTTNHDILNKMKIIVGNISLKDNVWVGANTIILQNVSLGPNVVVSAGSVVNRSFKNCVIGGTPARIIKQYKS